MKSTSRPRVLFRRLMIPFQWLFVRLPKGFTIPLIILLGVYFLYGFPKLNFWVGRYYEYLNQQASNFNANFSNEFLNTGASNLGATFIRVFSSISAAFLTLGLTMFGFWTSYWVTGQF